MRTISLLLLVAAWPAFIHAQAVADANVELEDRGTQVVLRNGIIEATISKSGANVSSLKFKGAEMISQAGRGADVYFSMDGGTNYRQPRDCIYSVKAQSPELR